MNQRLGTGKSNIVMSVHYRTAYLALQRSRHHLDAGQRVIHSCTSNPHKQDGFRPGIQRQIECQLAVCQILVYRIAGDRFFAACPDAV
ncbi:hypothetical protein D3C75_624940 [compost metagenome]